MKNFNQSKFKIGVKYCGNCNPKIYSKALVKNLENLNPDFIFTSYKDEKFDLLLIVNGCEVACATKPLFDGTVIVIDGSNYDLSINGQSSLALNVSKKIKKVISDMSYS